MALTVATAGDKRSGERVGDAWVIEGCDSIPKLFLRKTAERGDNIAMREKDFGIWQSSTWTDYREREFEVSLGLLSLGLQLGDVCDILSEDCK